MSAADEQRGADWVRERFEDLLKEHDASNRHRGFHILSPQDAGGERFAEGYWVLRVNIAGQFHNLDISEDDLNDLTESRKREIEEKLSRLAKKVRASAGPSIKNRP